MIWWIGLAAWAALGLLGLRWLPPAHHSWSRGGLVVLWLIAICICAMLGPIGLWQMIRLDRQERRIEKLCSRA